MSFVDEHLRILRTAGLPAWALLNLSALIDQSLTRQLEGVLRSAEGVGLELWLLAAGSILNSLLLPTLVSAFLLFGLFQSRGWVSSLPDFLGRVANSLYIETVRAWGASMRWALLLIVPGLIRLMQLTLVPLVVVCHRAYDEGRADALRVSTAYVNRRWGVFLLVLIGFQFIAPMVLTQLFDSWRSYFETPTWAIMSTLADLFVAVLFTQILFRLFDGIRRELGDDLVFQADRVA